MKVELKNEFAEDVRIGRKRIEENRAFPYKGREKYLNASESGSCIRRVWYMKRWPQGRKEGNGYSRRGQHLESYVIDSLRARGHKIIHAGEDQISIRDEERRLSATPDGIMVYDNLQSKLLEIKSFSPMQSVDSFPRANHLEQVKQAIGIVNAHSNFSNFSVSSNPVPINGCLLYINADDFDDMYSYEISLDTSVDDALWLPSLKAAKIFEAKEDSELLPEGTVTGECKHCEYTKACNPANYISENCEPRKFAPREMVKDAETYISLRRLVNEYKNQQDILKKNLIEYLNRLETSVVCSCGVKVSAKRISPRETFDYSAMIEDGIDLSPYKRSGRESIRLDVRPEKRGKERDEN